MICDRVAILVGGKVARQGRIDELNVTKQRYEIEVIPPIGGTLIGALQNIFIAAASPSPTAIVRGALPNGTWMEIEADTLRIGTVNPTEVQNILDILRAANITIRRVQAVRPSLEDLYLEAVINPTTGPSRGCGGGSQMIKTLALLLDSYRELNAKRLFWIVLVMSGLVVGAFAMIGIHGDAITILWWETPHQIRCADVS